MASALKALLSPLELRPTLFRGDEFSSAVTHDVQEVLHEVQSAEAQRTASCREAVDRTWKEVESTIELNRHRTIALTDALPKQLGAVESVCFWNEPLLREAFDLASILDDESADDEGSAQAGELPGIVRRKTTSCGSEATLSSSLSSRKLRGKRRGRPEAITLKRPAREASASAVAEQSPMDILDPMKKCAPIRRLFAPLLQRRASVPIECTILLNKIQEMQQPLAALESSMNDSAFNLPLHLPFRTIADYISRTLAAPVNGAALERDFETSHKPTFDELAKNVETVVREAAAALSHSVARDPASSAREAQEPSPSTNNDDSRRKIADRMWQVLEEEAALRASLHPRCLELIEDAIAVEEKMTDVLRPAQASAEDATHGTLARIREEAAAFTREATAIIDRVAQVRREGQAAYDADSAEIASRLKSTSYLVTQSQEAQEKASRRIREAAKELLKEQEKYEQLVGAHTTLLVQQKVVSTAHKQFDAACGARDELLREAEKTCRGLEALVARVEESASTLLLECERHVTRALSEEAFRKVRVSRRAVENAMSWYRCVGDISALQQRRFDSIMARVSDSWQMNYLLKHDKDVAARALEQCRGALSQVDAAWSAIAVHLAAFQIPIPSLARIDNDPKTVAARAAMLATDSLDCGRSKKMGDPIKQLTAICSSSRAVPPPPSAPRAAAQQSAIEALTPRPPQRVLAREVGELPPPRHHSSTPKGTRTAGGGRSTAAAAVRSFLSGTPKADLD